MCGIYNVSKSHSLPLRKKNAIYPHKWVSPGEKEKDKVTTFNPIFNCYLKQLNVYNFFLNGFEHHPRACRELLI